MREAKLAGEGPDLQASLYACNFDRVKALVDEDPNVVDVKLPNGAYPQAMAARLSHLCGTKTLAYLLDQDPQVNVIRLNDALLGSAMAADKEVVAILLKHGADPNGDPDDGTPDTLPFRKPLQAVLGMRWPSDAAPRLEVAELLVAAGARLDVPAAAAMGKTRALRAMLNRDPKLADSRSPDKPWGLKPMDWAMNYRQKESARILLEFLPDPTLKDFIIVGDDRAVRDYLDHHPGAAKLKIGAGPPLSGGDYPITIAVRVDDMDIARLLLDRGADPNTPGVMRETVQRGNVEMVKFLIDRGADVKDKPGWPRLTDIANSYKHPEIADIIRQAQ